MFKTKLLGFMVSPRGMLAAFLATLVASACVMGNTISNLPSRRFSLFGNLVLPLVGVLTASYLSLVCLEI